MTDEELYRRYLDGDEKSVDELMKRHESGLILYITGYLHDVHEAEDLMIEAFDSANQLVKDEVLALPEE